MLKELDKKYLVYAGLTLAILAPLLLPGHILTLDMALTPRLPMPDGIMSSYLFRTFLHIINFVLPTQIIEKLIFASILMLSSLGAHRLAAGLKITSPGQYLAGVLYMINPFTYSRFMAGQYSVLLGYALLPWFVFALLRLLVKPSARTAAKLVALTILISIISIHTVGLACIFAGLAVISALYRNRKKRDYINKLVGCLGASFAAVILLSSYWLVPLAIGSGKTADAIQGFGAGDRAAFATSGGSAIGKFGQIIRLQGFWAEDRGLYRLPGDNLPGWGLVALLVLGFVIYGAKRFWEDEQRYIVFIFGGSAIIGTLLAIASLNDILLNWIPAFGGYREPQKFVGLVALAFAIFFAKAASGLLEDLTDENKETAAAMATAGFFVLLVAFTPTMFWGFGSQLKPRHYPAAWAEANARLNQDNSDFRVLFLPWHLYMSFEFSDRLIMNPAEDYFDKPIVSSDDPEFKDSSPISTDPIAEAIGRDVLPGAKERDDFAERIKPYGIKYIVLSREEHDDYSWLERQPGITTIFEADEIRIFEVKGS